MNRAIKKLFRTAQVFFPGLVETKFALRRMWCDLFRVFPEKDYKALSFFPDPDNVVYLDIGGNRGQGIDAFLIKKRNCLVHAFEPNPYLSERLVRQYRNNKRVTIHGFGLGERAEYRDLYVPFYRKWMFDGLASFDLELASHWLEKRIFFYDPKSLSIKKLPCELKKLDDLELTPFFIKIEVQGHEWCVLKGAEKTLKAYEPIVLVLVPSPEVVAFLKELGYEMYHFEGGKFVPTTAINSSVFFVPRSKRGFWTSSRSPE